MRTPLEDVPISPSGTRLYAEVAPKPDDGPIDLTALFSRGPIEIDIGFGRGASLFNRLRHDADARLIGIEIKHKWVYKVEERRRSKLEVQKAERLVVWAGDAREILERCTPVACVQRFYVHFPDPWWKRKHQHRLVVADRFLAQAARLLKPGGELFVQTDVKERSEEYAASVRAQPGFEEPEYIDSNVFFAISGREEKAIEDGLPVYRFVARRDGSAVMSPDRKCDPDETCAEE